MKLNPDCIRDILLTAEVNENMYYPGQYDLLDKYDRQEVIYHINQCAISELIIVVKYVDGECRISDLTPMGHELISQIRSTSNWNKVLKKLKQVGTSIKTILDFASIIKDL